MENPLAVRSSRRANVSSQRSNEGTKWRNSPTVISGRPANVSRPAARRGDLEGGTHFLSDLARQTLENRQHGVGGRGDLLAVRSTSQAMVSKPLARRGIQVGASPTVRSSRQANVNHPAARRGIRNGELTRYHIKPSSER